MSLRQTLLLFMWSCIYCWQFRTKGEQKLTAKWWMFTHSNFSVRGGPFHKIRPRMYYVISKWRSQHNKFSGLPKNKEFWQINISPSVVALSGKKMCVCIVSLAALRCVCVCVWEGGGRFFWRLFLKAQTQPQVQNSKNNFSLKKKEGTFSTRPRREWEWSCAPCAS